MKKWNAIEILIAVISITLFLSQPGRAAEKDLVIKIATLAPEGSSWIKTFSLINGEVAKKTENRVKLRIYPGGVLGDETDMLRKMKIGQIQGAALTSGGLSSMFKEIDVLQIPFLFEKYEEVDHIIKKMESFFRKGFEENGYVLLGWSEGGFLNLMSTVPVSSVADLKKAKVWIWEESPMARAIFDEAGVSAIPLSVPDVLVGLQTGMVEVVYAPPTGAISLQWFTKIKYLTDVPLAYMAGGVVVKVETFNRIPQAYQASIIETFRHHLDQLKSVTRSENLEAVKVMSKQGVKIIKPSKDQVQEFKKLSEKATAQISGQTFSQKTLREVTSSLEIYRREGR